MPRDSNVIMNYGSTPGPEPTSLIDRRRDLLTLLGVPPETEPASRDVIRLIGGRYLDLPLDDWAERSVSA